MTLEQRNNPLVASGPADLDCTYHFYLDGQSIVEQRNGSDQVIKQQVWGITYVDELLQVASGNMRAEGELRPYEKIYDIKRGGNPWAVFAGSARILGCMYVRRVRSTRRHPTLAGMGTRDAADFVDEQQRDGP